MIRFMVLPSVEANTVETANASDTWECFQVGSITLIHCKKLVPDDNKKKSLKKGKVEGIQSLTHVEFMRPITSLQYATPNTERHLDYFSC